MELIADISLWAIAIVGVLSLIAVVWAAFSTWRCRDKSDYVEMNIPRHRIGIGVTILLILTMIVTYLLEHYDYVDMIIDTMGVLFVVAILTALYGWTRLIRRKKKGI